MVICIQIIFSQRPNSQMNIDNIWRILSNILPLSTLACCMEIPGNSCGPAVPALGKNDNSMAAIFFHANEPCRPKLPGS